ncbi:chemotaxis protein CheB [Telluribacter sp.]|jgi:two-component system chemotaxis response regulator CheB|uniref:chemotaxis protein CheB n=1 Tax=Telluribacter sp. TaxID=1978767 RepID=UPI002E116F92|nr:chemotaxis protein CheB [Telluribacter sp.]
MDEKPQFIITVGASAGGISALQELVVQFPEDIDAAVFIVLHLSKRGIAGLLVHRLQHLTHLPCVVASEGIPIKKGHIYVAPPDNHLLIKKDQIKISNGPEENRWRPSIDVMMRSAAVAYGERAIGIVLTGLLNDGTAGMIAIKKCGGTCLVQDPNEAEYPDMPLSVISNTEVDYCFPLSQMGFVLNDIIRTKEITGKPIPPDIAREAEIVENAVTRIDVNNSLGSQSTYACPDCGGVLTELNDNNFRRYRCYTGHVYSESELMDNQTHQMESTLWVALRMMEEKRHLLTTLTREEKHKGLKNLAADHQQRADDLAVHIENIKEIIFSVSTQKSPVLHRPV